MSGLGEAAEDQGDIDSAVRYFEECIELDRTLGDTASTLGNLGWALRRRGEHQRAIALLEEAGALFQELGETPHLPHVLCELAAALADQGEVARALSLYRECGRLLWDMGDKTLMSGGFEGIAMLAGRQGQAEQPARLCSCADFARLNEGACHSAACIKPCNRKLRASPEPGAFTKPLLYGHC